MRLTKEELAKHNAKVMKIAEIRCDTAIPGVSVSLPDYINNLGWTNVQLALPCGVIREHKRKVNAMQVRTGSYTTSLAKEKTKYDDKLGNEYVDDTDYLPYTGEDGDIYVASNSSTTSVRSYAKGILDL